MRLVVCPAASLAAVCREERPDGVVTIASPGGEPALVLAPHRLHLAFNDISEPRPPLVAPDEAAVEAVLDFAGAVASGRLVVSCELGVSRSTALAFALACRAAPGRPEREVAAALRRACPVATPNPLVVALADAALGRAGQMVEAVRLIGRGADYAPYRAFVLEPWPGDLAGPQAP